MSRRMVITDARSSHSWHCQEHDRCVAVVITDGCTGSEAVAHFRAQDAREFAVAICDATPPYAFTCPSCASDAKPVVSVFCQRCEQMQEGP